MEQAGALGFQRWHSREGAKTSMKAPEPARARGMAGRMAAGGCHLFQEMRSCGSDKGPTTGNWDQLRPFNVFCMAQKPKLLPDARAFAFLLQPILAQKLAAFSASQEFPANRRSCMRDPEQTEDTLSHTHGPAGHFQALVDPVPIFPMSSLPRIPRSTRAAQNTQTNPPQPGRPGTQGTPLRNLPAVSLEPSQ